MNLSVFLDQLAGQGIELWPDGDQLGYRAPEGSLTPSLVATIKEHKADLVDLLTHGSETHALSHGQWVFWFEEQMAAARTTYNVSLAMRIHAPIDPAILQRALQMLVNRHPMLRTTFEEKGGAPVQRIYQYQEVAFATVDMSDQKWEAVYSQVMATHAQPFDLVHGPIFRASLFSRTPTDHTLIYSAHHIVCDGLSLRLMLDELPKLYAIATKGEGEPLAPHKAHYADYVAWQQEMLAREGDDLLAFWQQKLTDAPATLNLQTDFPRPSVRTYEGASQPIAISPQRTQQLRELARAEGVTLYMLLLAAYQLLLYRYTGQEDILVESRMVGRSKPEFFSLVGNFFSPVVMRANLAHHPTFRDFLQQVRHTTLESMKHQNYPFSLLVEQLQIERDPARSPLVQVSFGLNKSHEQSELWQPHLMINNAPPKGMLGDWLITLLNISLTEGTYELDLQLLELEDRLVGALSYNTSLFDERTIGRMVANFETLLMGILQDPSAPICDLPLLSIAERQQLLVDWNETAAEPIVEPNVNRCIHELFEEQVERTPDATAIVLDVESENTDTPLQMTYHQLNERANQLAHHLRASGVGPGRLVGVAVDYSTEMVVGLLGVLKAGGAYVPIDPAYPVARLQQMIDEAEITILLTQEHLRTQLPTQNQMILALDRMDAQLRQMPTRNLPLVALPDDLIYTIFTSGSTGKPKGAGVTHRGFANLLEWYIHDLGLTATDRVLLVTSLSFDLTQKNIFAPLLTGGALYLAEQPYFDPGQLCRTIQHHAISWINCTPSIFYHLTTEETAQGTTLLSALRTVVLGGEPIHLDRLQKWLAEPDRQIRLVNSYGPTECTDVCAAYILDTQRIKDLDDAAATNMPIGRPIRNVQLYVLGEAQQPVPLGAVGELYIGGAGVGAGYHNDPTMTAARFIANPFASSPSSEQLYRTGDAVKYLPDGNILFLGRIDNQVKIRGMRVELGEIESTLSQHPLVQQAVVAYHQSQLGEERLVAYFTPEPGLGFDATVGEAAVVLRAYVASKLPPHMVPAAFLLLGTIPLTPSGKVDRNALPAPDLAPDQPTTPTRSQPRTPLERELGALWAEELGVAEIDINARFFALGGDSFTAIRLIAKLKERGILLPLRQLMQEPTVAAVASWIEGSNGSGRKPEQEKRSQEQAEQKQHVNDTATLSQRQRTTSLGAQPALNRLRPPHHAAEMGASGSSPMTGNDYLESLRDGREVWIYGERVADVTTHPAFRNQARMVARLYDSVHQPEMKQILTCQADMGGDVNDGSFTHPFFRASYTQVEQVASRDAVATWQRIGYGWMGRAPDFMASLLGMLGPNADLYAPYDANACRWYSDFQQRMPYVNHALVNPPVDRNRSPDEVGDVYIHVERETDAGLIVSGAKNITTNAALTNYSFVGHDGGAPIRNREFAATFLLPMHICGDSRNSYEQ